MSAASTLSFCATSVNPASDAGPANLFPLHPRKALAAKRKGLSTRAWSVLCSLAAYANKKDDCWPKIQTLANDENVSRSTISRAVRELVDKGYLQRTQRLGTSNLWHLKLDPFDLVPPPSPGSSVTGGGVINDMPPPGGSIQERSGYTELSSSPPPTKTQTPTVQPPPEAPVPGAGETTPSMEEPGQQQPIPPVSEPLPTPGPDLDAREKATVLIQTIRSTHLQFLAAGPSPYPRHHDDIREWYPALRTLKRIPAGPDRDAWLAELLEIIRTAYHQGSWWAGKIPWALNLEKSLPRLLLLRRTTRIEAEQRARSQERQRAEQQLQAQEAQRVSVEHQRPDDERQDRRASIQQRIRAAMVQARREGLSGLQLKQRVEQLVQAQTHNAAEGQTSS